MILASDQAVNGSTVHRGDHTVVQAPRWAKLRVRSIVGSKLVP